MPIDIDLDFYSKQKKRYCEIRGTKKKLKWDLNLNKIKITNYKTKKIEQFNYSDDMYRNQIKFFLFKKQFKNSLEESIKVLKFIEEVKRKDLYK